MPVNGSSLISVLWASWPMWAVVIGGYLFLRLCRIVYCFHKRTNRLWK